MAEHWVGFEEMVPEAGTMTMDLKGEVQIAFTRPCLLNLDEHNHAFPVTVVEMVDGEPRESIAIQFKNRAIVRGMIEDLLLFLGGKTFIG